MAKSTVAVRFTGDVASLKRATDQAEGHLGRFGSKVAGALGTAAKAGAGAAAVIGGLAIKGGFQRAMNIEDAQASLRGLGHDAASIEKIMDSALASVKGTAFGLGDAATIAATAVAAGIKPGDELTRTLKLTANASALARIGLSEMGSILNKVWTSGRVGTEELNQLADRGIPIWTKLAEHYKVNATQLRKMVSAGKVDAETFAEVLEGTVGTAAEEMGKTTRGAWANMLAALSRAGEKFLSGIFPLFRKGLGGITKLFDALSPMAEKAGQGLVVALDAVQRWWTVNGPRIQAAAERLFRVIETKVREIIPLVRDWVKGALADLSKWWTDNGPTIISIAQNIIDIVVKMGEFIVDTAKAIVDNWDTVGAPFEALVSIIEDAVIPGLEKLTGWIADNEWVIQAFGTLIGVTLVGHYVKLATEATISSVKQAAAWVQTQVAAIKATAITVAQMAAQAAKWAWLAIRAALHAAAIVASWVATQVAAGVATIAHARAVAAQQGGWAALAASAASRSAAIAKAWLAVLGPMGAVIAAAETINNMTGNKMNPNNLNLLERLNPFKAFQGMTFSLPKFDSGGVMPGPRGKHALALVAGGETVLPTHKSGVGVGGVAVHFHNPVLMGTSQAEVERWVVQALNRARSQGVR